MKKCMIMLTLVIMTLIIARLTERKQEVEFKEDITVKEKLMDEIALDQTSLSENVQAKN